MQFDGSAVDLGELERLTDGLLHRGRNGRGTFVDRHVGLGQQRLAIIDLTAAADQPMPSDDGSLILTFNGEIYNFKEEREQLKKKRLHVQVHR